jgi:hypothetical protein
VIPLEYWAQGQAVLGDTERSFEDCLKLGRDRSEVAMPVWDGMFQSITSSHRTKDFDSTILAASYYGESESFVHKVAASCPKAGCRPGVRKPK